MIIELIEKAEDVGWGTIAVVIAIAELPEGLTDKVVKLESDVSSITSGIDAINGILEGK